VFGPNPILINCTIVKNSADKGGGVYATGLEDRPVVIRNSIIQRNSTSRIYDFLKETLRGGTPEHRAESLANLFGEFLDVTYSNVAGGWLGLGVFDLDPLFVDTDGGDYRRNE